MQNPEIQQFTIIEHFEPNDGEGNNHSGIDKNIQKKPAKWSKKLEALLLNEHNGHQNGVHTHRWRLVYVLNLKEWEVSLRACRLKLKKDGTIEELSTVYNYDLNDTHHFDSVDQLLLPHLAQEKGLVISFALEHNHNHSNRSYRATNSQLLSSALQHLEHKEVYLERDFEKTLQRLSVVPEPLTLSFGLENHDKGEWLKAGFSLHGTNHTLHAPIHVLVEEPLWVLSGPSIYRVSNVEKELLNHLSQHQWAIHVGEDEHSEFHKAKLPRLLERFAIAGDAISIKPLSDGFAKRIYLKEENGALNILLRCAYSGHEAPVINHTPHFVVNGEEKNLYYRIERKFEEEAHARREILDSYTSEVNPGEFLPRQQPLDWLMQKLPTLVEKGFEIYGKENLSTLRVRTSPSLNVVVASNIDWFDLELIVDYDGVKASFKELYHSIQKNERYVKLADGSLGLIPEEWLKKFKRVFALTDSEGEMWRFSRSQLSLIDQLFTESQLLRTDTSLEDLKKKIKQMHAIESTELPADFHGELRQYQKAGYDWLRFLKDIGLNGCLADDMGLGKTIQALAFLQHEHNNGAKGPTLIVVPTSIVFNWVNEAERFSPSLRILTHTGAKRKKIIEEFANYDLIVTTYGVLRRDIELMKDVEFHYVVLDESQSIKNTVSQNAKAVKILNSKHRLALTGTPVENNLMELWSQFDFLNPGLLGTRTSFLEQFARPIERDQDEEAADMLRKLIYPFILRRTKNVVASELPPKTESVVYCDMDKEQRDLYTQWRDYYRAAILKSINTVGLENSKFKVLEGLMKLRQVCCHPWLVEHSFQGTSGKFEVWKDMIEQLLAEKHKTLIFSQFVRMLRHLSDHLDTQDIDYEYLDGQTHDRERRVDRFQTNDSVKLFLISLKAGGVGLNLTAADYVIHYDPWWNPAVEAQATDRTHRIGQTKAIFSYKLITKDTIEEKILNLQEKKKELVQSIITAEAGVMKMITQEDIEMLFG